MKLHEYQQKLRDEATASAALRRIKYQQQIDQEIAAGKWRCPQCLAAMRRRPNTAILFCAQEHV